jgi:predicted ATPase
MQSQLNLPYYFALLAHVLLMQGEVEQGFAAVEEALDVVQRTGQRNFLSELYRLKGELLLKQTGKNDEAEALFQQALQTAETQGARSLRLRAAMSLFRLWSKGGGNEEARALLERVYSTFTEGFDTADLKEARALLAL